MKLRENCQAMIRAAEDGTGMDIIIVSTTSEPQEAFWQERLMAGRGQICKSDAEILVVHEDWPGGAGNGLGTLYAIRKAAAKARDLFNTDLLQRLQDGAAVALYHTAGKGTRLAPLPGSENNNKPAVKLPGLLTINGRTRAMTILEGVIRQTAIYAPSRRGRISVFWGDQIFIPSAAADYEAGHHVDILARLAPMPDRDNWQAKNLHTYGLIAVAADGDASQVEKISYDTARELIDKGVIRVDGGIGVSLGSFSVSAAMAAGLLQEFAPEIEAKAEKLDTDPHFWMPMTLDRETYLKMMADKGVETAAAAEHYERMQNFIERFRAGNENSRLFGCVDIGADSYWWDYGQLRNYLDENLKLTQSGDECEVMRQFFGVGKRQLANQLGPDVDLDTNSVVLNCNIRSATIRNSVLVGVNAETAELDRSVLVDVTVPEVRGKQALFYNVADGEAVRHEPGCVRADAFVPGHGQLRMCSHVDRDGKVDWEETLTNNPLSYSKLHQANQDVSVSEAVQLADETHQTIHARLKLKH